MNAAGGALEISTVPGPLPAASISLPSPFLIMVFWKLLEKREMDRPSAWKFGDWRSYGAGGLIEGDESFDRGVGLQYIVFSDFLFFPKINNFKNRKIEAVES